MIARGLETFNAALARRAVCLRQEAQGDGAESAGVAASIAALRGQEPAGLPWHDVGTAERYRERTR